MYSFRCGDNSKNKLKSVSKSQSKHVKYKEYKNCLDCKEYQHDCDIYLIRSLSHEMLLQRVKKSALSLFDDKRCYINKTEKKPWN